jgi:hypothetical protein
VDDMVEVPCGTVAWASDLIEVEDSYDLDGSGITITDGEFAFCATGPNGYPTALMSKGFKHVSRMRNWWKTHLEEWRVMDFWWWENPNKKAIKPFRYASKPKGWGERNENFYTRHPKDASPFFNEISYGGCGFKLFQPPIVKRKLLNYFGLVRLESVAPIQLHRLKRLGFRPLARGTKAHYFINGWDYKTYTPKIEDDFFKKFGTQHGGEHIDTHNISMAEIKCL